METTGRRQRKRRHRHRTAFSAFLSSSLLLLFIFSSFLLCAPVVKSETEIKWTPNDNEERTEGPLPLSQQQREQLLQLEQTIRQSPNPQETLIEAAEANKMDPNELLGLLERNHNDMMQAGGGGGGGRGMIRKPTNFLMKMVTSVVFQSISVAAKNPKAFIILITAMFVVLYVGISAPRTGLVISGQRSFLSKGPTTIWNPPTSFIQRRYLDDDGTFPSRIKGRTQQQSVSSAELWKDLVPLLQEEDEDITTTTTDDDDGGGDVPASSSAVWYTPKQLRQHKITNIKQAASAQSRIQARDFISAPSGITASSRRRSLLGAEAEDKEEIQDEDEDEDGDEEDDDLSSEVLDLLLDHASDVLSKGKLSEYCSLRFVIPSDESATMMKRRQRAVLVVRGMGDWARYGLLPLRVTHTRETENQVGLTMESFPGFAHWDGQLHVEVAENDGGNGEEILVRVVLVVPKKTHNKVPKKIALSIVESLCDSIAASISTRTKQSLARKTQSARFQGKAQERAKVRKQTRFAKMKEIEEMAADRRRRWQRQNPNSGHYRPSGDRMKSPNNAVYN